MKTISIRKISSVAIAALGFGLLSAIPANAVTTSATTTVSASSALTFGGTATAATATGGVGVPVTFTLNVTTVAPDNSDTIIWTPTLTGTAVDSNGSAVTVNTAKTSVTPTETTTHVAFGAATAATGAITGTSTAVAGATGNVVYGFTPDVAGTYVYTFAVTGNIDNKVNTSVSFTYTALKQFDSGAVLACTVGLENNSVGTTTCTGATGGQVSVTYVSAQTVPIKIVPSAGMTIVGVTGSTYGAGSGLDDDGDDEHSYVNGTSFVEGIWYDAADTSTITLLLSSATAGDKTLTLSSNSTSTGAATTLTVGTISWSAASSILLSSANSAISVALDGACPATAAAAAWRASAATAAVSTVGAMHYENGAAGVGGANYDICVLTRDGNDNAITPTSLFVSTTKGFVAGATAKGGTGPGSADDAIASGMNAFGFIGDEVQTGVATITATAVYSTSTITLTTQFLIHGDVATVALANNAFADTIDTTITEDAITITAKDAGGNAIPYQNAAGAGWDTATANLAVASSNPTQTGTPVEGNEWAQATVVSSGAADATTGQTTNGALDITCSTTKTEKITIKLYGGVTADVPAKDIISNEVTFYCSGSASTVAITAGKTTLTKGESTTVNVSVKDANGFPVGDGTTVTLAATGGSAVAPSSKTTLNGSFETAATFVAASGDASSTLTAIAGSKSASQVMTVGSGANSLLTQIDALNAKVVALNALIAKIMKKLGVK